MDLTRNINGKLLRCGYTTGSCAAGAAKAATQMLLTGNRVDSVELDTPKGIRLTLDILDAVMDGDRASCAVRKDSGDDPDVTAGMLVYATAERIESGITIDGGEGVGRVTKPGLDQPVGAAAIN
ncbi:MAG: cobalt-precorrin-5B (C(1))-methyltransferase, partial [Oscillospiraceae bacterium]|nr:cobalt-precorrin-5B (C(1))-methyltransferase [Oscillospiraceae bacterium]